MSMSISIWTTNTRIPIRDYVERVLAGDGDTVITEAERKVRTALTSAASDPDQEVYLAWQYVIPGHDPTASNAHVHGDTHVSWVPGEVFPDDATELICRGRTVT